MSDKGTFVFGPFRLSAGRRELFAHGKSVRLGSRAFDLLLSLVQRQGQLATKEELMAEVWPGTVVEESNLQVQISALRKILGEEPEGARYLLTVPGRGYRFVASVERADAANGASTSADRTWHSPPALALPDKPSIAVLPFANMSGDPEQEYFADGVVEEIITAMSRMRWLFVIARNSSFTYKGRDVDVKRVGHELGVRYVLEGGVRKAGGRVRITGQLIDAATGMHLWADRFEGSLEDIFDLQDQVAASVVGAIGPKLEQAEIERAKRKPTGNLDAYDYYLRAMASLYQWTKESNNEALRLLYMAIELDPNFASAYGVAAWSYVWRKTQGWVTDVTKEASEGIRLAQRAVELGKDDAIALSAGGYALAHIAGDLDDGAAFIDRALVANPNLAGTWLNSGWVRVWLGEPELAIKHLAQAMRLSPRDPILFRMEGATASAHFFAGRYDEASFWAQKALRENPNYQQALRVSAASHALAGRLQEAQKAIARVRQLDPDFRVGNMKDRLPKFRRAEDFARYAEGLRKAGVPE